MLKSLFGIGVKNSATRDAATDGMDCYDVTATELHERGILIDKSLELADAFCTLLPVLRRAEIFSPEELAEVEKAVRDFERQRAKVLSA